jgi:hypothetical protein
MGWFTKLCRNTGLMIHHAAKPVAGNKKIISQQTQEKQINQTTTLRRTTIEEIEITSNGSDNNV